MRVVVINRVSLDGVMQAPGNPEEDTRDGFEHGGWATERSGDAALGAAMGERMGQDFTWLFGRRSYEGMLSYWNRVGGPFKEGLNQIHKYVASSGPDTDLPWPNSTLLTGDVPSEVAALREQRGSNLVIMGSGHLIRSLLPHELIDELLLMIHPIVLGSGQRLFGSEGQARTLQLLEATTTESGVLLVTYGRDSS